MSQLTLVEQRGNRALYRDAAGNDIPVEFRDGKPHKIPQSQWAASPNAQTQKAMAKADAASALSETASNIGRYGASGLAALPPGTWNPVGLVGVLGLSAASTGIEAALQHQFEMQDPTQPKQSRNVFSRLLQDSDYDGMRDKFIADAKAAGGTPEQQKKHAKRAWETWKKDEWQKYQDYWASWATMSGRAAGARNLYDKAFGESRIDELGETEQNIAIGAGALAEIAGGGGIKGAQKLYQWGQRAFPNMDKKYKVASGAAIASPTAFGMAAPHFVDGDEDEKMTAAQLASIIPSLGGRAAIGSAKWALNRYAKYLPDRDSKQSRDVLTRFLNDDPYYKMDNPGGTVSETRMPAVESAARILAGELGTEIKTLPLHNRLDLARAASVATQRPKVIETMQKNNLGGQVDDAASGLQKKYQTETIPESGYIETPGEKVFDALKGDGGVERTLFLRGTRIYDNAKLPDGTTLNEAPLFRGMDEGSDLFVEHAKKIVELAESAVISGAKETGKAGAALLRKLGKWDGDTPPKSVLEDLKGKDILPFLHAIRREKRTLSANANSQNRGAIFMVNEAEDAITKMFTDITPRGFSKALDEASTAYKAEVADHVGSGGWDAFHLGNIRHGTRHMKENTRTAMLDKMVDETGRLKKSDDVGYQYGFALNGLKAQRNAADKMTDADAIELGYKNIHDMKGAIQQRIQDLANSVAGNMVRKMGGKSLMAEYNLWENIDTYGEETVRSLAPAIRRATNPLRQRIAERLAGRGNVDDAAEVDKIIGDYYKQGAKGMKELREIAHSVAKKSESASDFILSDITRRATSKDGYDWIADNMDALEAVEGIGGKPLEAIKALAVLKFVATKTEGAVKGSGGSGILRDIVEELNEGRGTGKLMNWLKNHANQNLRSLASNVKALAQGRQGSAPFFAQMFSQYGEGQSARMFTDALIQEVVHNGKGGAVMAKVVLNETLTAAEQIQFEKLSHQIFRKVGIMLSAEDPAFAKQTEHPLDKS